MLSPPSWMNKTLRWLIAFTMASLISYALFATVGQLIGTLRYNDPSNHRPAVSINFMPIYKKEHKQTPSDSPPAPAPVQSLKSNAYKKQRYESLPLEEKHNTETPKEQRYKSVPLEEKHNIKTPPKPEPLSITKHTPANRGLSPSGLQPVFRVEPIYPMYAITRGIEGWVKIEFAITMNGKVVNPKVVASDPPRIFEQTALTAIYQWRYPPGNESKSSAHIKFELRNE